MSSIVLKVDLLAGCTVKQAAQDMIDYAQQTGHMVTADFNGYYMIATGIETAEILEKGYQNWIQKRPK